MLMAVIVLPDPDSPTIPRRVPDGTVSCSISTMAWRPMVTLRSWISSIK